MSPLEVRCDTATIIVARELKTTIKLPEGGTLHVRDSLAYKILKKLNLKRITNWNGQDLEAEDGSMYLKIKEDKLEIQLKGSFFVFNKNWEKALNEVLEVIRGENLAYYFTRLDILYLTRENLFKPIKKTDFKKLTTTTHEKARDPFWFSVFSTVFGITYYDKRTQLEKIKKKNPKYYQHYLKKYGIKEPLYHFELRQLLFRRKNRRTHITSELVPSSNNFPFIFENVRLEIEDQILSRVKFNKAIKDLIKGGK